MHLRTLVLAWMIMLLPAAAGVAADVYVDGQGCPEIGSGTAHVPFCRIQDAVDAARHGDAVIVRPGVYLENVIIIGKSVTLRSIDPAAADIVAATIIDGGNPASMYGSAVTIEDHGLTDGALLLDGLTLRSGRGRDDRGRKGGGIYCRRGAPTIRNCVLSGNQAAGGVGGGIYCAAGSVTVEHSTFDGNQAEQGGGIWAELSDVTLRRVILSGNSQGAVYLSGGQLNMWSTRVTGNHADPGAAGLAIAGGGAVLVNCTVADNSAATAVAVNAGPLTCTNSILWADAGTVQIAAVNAQLEVSYCDVRGGLEAIDTAGGTLDWVDNLALDPGFVNAPGGDYRLAVGSAAIDAGHPLQPPDGGALDLEGQPRLLGTRVDLGADEFAADCDANGLLDFEELRSGAAEDCNDNGALDICEPDPDCNANGRLDACDLASGSDDCDAGGVPDECQTDADGDGLIDPCDGCPADPLKQGPGLCGCSRVDEDADGDQVSDCVDACPGHDDAADSDGDGWPDGCDGCAQDPHKQGPGSCGCGVADVDGNGDGAPDCVGQCVGPGGAVTECLPGPTAGARDGADDAIDNCTQANPDPLDFDGDGSGAACDPDDDQDGVDDVHDGCPATALGSMVDSDGCPSAAAGAQPNTPADAQTRLTIADPLIDGEVAYLAYVIQVTNLGGSAAYDVALSVRLDLPEGVTVVYASNGALIRDGQLHWPVVGALAGGGEFVRTFLLAISADVIQDTPLTIPLVEVTVAPPRSADERAEGPAAGDGPEDSAVPRSGICGAGCGPGGATFCGLLLGLSLVRRAGRNCPVRRRTRPADRPPGTVSVTAVFPKSAACRVPVRS